MRALAVNLDLEPVVNLVYGPVRSGFLFQNKFYSPTRLAVFGVFFFFILPF